MELKPIDLTAKIMQAEQNDFLDKINEICEKNPINYDTIVELSEVAAQLDTIKSPGYSAQLLRYALGHWC